MDLVHKMDDLGKPAWIGLMVLSFILFWPAGLALLIFLLGSGRMRCGRQGGPGSWYRSGNPESQIRGWWRANRHSSSGNVAFDEYREETLRRLEDEQKEFRTFLEKLRHAKDKAEFDQFMADRGRRSDTPEQPLQS
jgi:hypothetical protein